MYEGGVSYFIPFCLFLNIFHVGRPTGWPARSPDFSPLDLFVWENTETTVYGAEVSDAQDIQQQVHNRREMILWRLGISGMSDSHGSHVQLLAWKLDTLSILCNLPKVVALKSCYRNLCSYVFFFLYCADQLLKIGCLFFVNSVNMPYTFLPIPYGRGRYSFLML